MTEWVALLRGVNVNGITVRSAPLRAVFEQAGFDDVSTVLASGNVRFASKDPASARTALARRIEKALEDEFGYDAWIVLVTRAELRRAVDAFPFDADDADRQPWVVFGSDGSVLDELVDAGAGLDDRKDPVARGTGVLYWNPRTGTTTDSPFGRILARTKYRSTTTTRSLRTLIKILG